MSYGVNSIQIHKKLRLDKRAGSDNWYARLTLPNGKRLVKTTKAEDLESATSPVTKTNIAGAPNR